MSIKQDLRDSSKTTISIETAGGGKTTKTGRKMIKVDKEIHCVQILDPTTGTGTFLAEIVRHVYQFYAVKPRSSGRRYKAWIAPAVLQPLIFS
ncbi:hypothetical protein [Neisseria leonii]|uniref:hypothetical protein n=1 Tax=Neisseria leonii TaxID=2995413 RepID=UPI00237B2933|nr:hypothetical protein [Neisseria sp. 3986]MDD9324963.1 hypothetical protein [Neisseria sp. 3986]